MIEICLPNPPTIMCNVPEFVRLLKDRKFPIEGMRMEVIEYLGEEDMHKGVITLMDEEHFTLEWNLWECLLSCLAHFRFRDVLTKFIPYCLGFRPNGIMHIDCDHAKKLWVTKAIP